ncbi:MAG TPA: SDR family oxidoreductase, partial [Burkholderiaceae bacterium]|nr:SDR family oxidoreductase [Burkholderiaceae bacterium]
SYTLSKAGLQAATVMLAQALAPRVRVIGVAPGLTLPSYLQKDAKDFERGQKLSLTGKSSSAADVAATVLFAAQNQSMTGNVILVDGGQHLMGLQRDVSFL